MSKPNKQSTRNAVQYLQNLCHNAAYKAGWWTNLETSEDLTVTGNFNVPEKLCLIHSEVSEAMEGHRKGLKDTHLPERDMLEVELADVLIRVFDLAGAMNMNLAGAVADKLEYNANRADHKLENRMKEDGKKF